MHPLSSRLSLFVIVPLLHLVVGCLPSRGTLPDRTWRPEAAEASCEPASLLDPRGPQWSEASRKALEAAMETKRPAVVSAIGCRVDVLDRCKAPSAYRHATDRYEVEANAIAARDLDGDCAGATHVVRTIATGTSTALARTPIRVELSPLSLTGMTLTGTWRGVIRQPGGPYEVYDVTMNLVQDGDRVKGTTRIATVDEAYWGDLRFEGRLEGTTLFFADAEIIDDNLGVFLAWCAKGGYLVFDPQAQRLRGPWKADMCAPGAVDVRYVGEHRGAFAGLALRRD